MASMSNRADQLEPAAVRELLRAMVGRRVAVVGDVMLDAYLLGRIDRISPEAPVPVFQIEREEHMLGGAANVAKCLVALGARAGIVGVVGNDANARLLRDECRNIGIDDHLVADPDRPTTLKSRVIAQQQQMIRLDRERPGSVTDAVERELIDAARAAVAEADGVVISDYSKGALTDAVCRATIEAANRKGVPVVVDPKRPPWDRYRGATLIKPNHREAGWYVGGRIEDDVAATAAARAILAQLGCAHTLVTRREQGMTFFSAGDAEPTHVRTIHRDVFDPTGAGDMVATVLVLALAAGAEPITAVRLANVAAAVEVSKFGVAVVTDSEILELLGERGVRYERKVMSRDDAARVADDARKRGKRVVFTNGCFDILHVGHVNYLERSAQQGDALIVGVNTDASVRRLKGPGRPVQNENDRAHIIASQACVDAVVLFDEDTPIDLIKAVRPDIITKGADYGRKENVVGWDAVESWGGRVELIDLIAGRSTTNLLAKATR
jgi:D-beta-D-heptose 7-phosphate kinase/D-beta-D-heptose 1-phosphate adenosyltransferase